MSTLPFPVPSPENSSSADPFGTLLAKLASGVTEPDPAALDETSGWMLETIAAHYGFAGAALHARSSEGTTLASRRACWSWGAVDGGTPAGTAITLRVPVSGRVSYAATFHLHQRTNASALTDTVRELRVALGLLAALLDRRDLQRGRARQAAFEGLLIKLAHLFQAPVAIELERELPRGLRWVAEFFDMERVAIFSYADHKGWRLERCHVAASAAPQPVEPPARAVNDYVRRLTRGDLIRLSTIAESECPPTEPELTLLRSHDITTHVSVPLTAQGRLLGALTADSARATPACDDDEEEARRLRIVGELFGAVLKRQHVDRRHRTQRADLAYVGRVAFMGELSATLLNDFTQPLSGVLSNAQAAQRWLASDTPPLAEARLALTDIVANALRATTLVRNLRDLLKKRYPHKVLLHVNGVIADIDHLIRAIALEHQIEPEIELTPDLPEIYGDRVQLQQVVLNLVRNAAEAMRGEAAGTAHLLVKTESWQQAGVLVSVSDSGPPLTEDDTAKLFEPFFSTKADGLGMGLAISRSIVESHEGAIWWVRRPDRGLCVYFALPGKPEP